MVLCFYLRSLKTRKCDLVASLRSTGCRYFAHQIQDTRDIVRKCRVIAQNSFHVFSLLDPVLVTKVQKAQLATMQC